MILCYEPLRAMKGHILADFITDHRVDIGSEVACVNISPWKLFFDGSVCKEGQGIGYVLVSPNGLVHESSVRIEYPCTNNQIEYEALLLGLTHLEQMGIKDVDIFGDSLLVVQQVEGEFQCLDGLLRSYLDRCLNIIKLLDTFTITHISRDKNGRANLLAQQASGYKIERGIYFVQDISIQGGIFSVNGNGSGHGVQKVEHLGALDWRMPLIECLQDPSSTKDRKVRWQVLKYTLIDNELYRRTIDGLLLKCLDEEQSRVAMGEVHEGMCGTHQSAHKMRWMLKRAGFYWPTMLEDCF